MFRPSSYLSAPLPPAAQKTRQRRILVVTPFSAHGTHPAERVAAKLIEEIAASHPFKFIRAASGGAHENPPQGFLAHTIHSLRRMAAQLPGLSESVRAADIVWLHGSSSLASVLAFRAARAYGKPVFVTQHDGPADRAGLLRRATGFLADQFFAEDILRGARLASFTSDAAAEYYYRRIAFRAPVKIIPNGADTEMFQPASLEKRRAIRARFALRDDQPVLLYAGSFGGDGIAVVRSLASRLPDWRFWLAGEGSVNPGSWFQTNLQAFEHPAHETMAELYQAADLMILPYAGSALPLAAQEAMASGLPVMCSPALAKGCHSARDYLWTVDIFDGDPRATASLWASRLKAGRPLLPLDGPKTELSDLAKAFWDWPLIAGHYAEMLQGLCRRA